VVNRGEIHAARSDRHRLMIVVSPSRHNELANHVLVVPLFTSMRPESSNVALAKGEAGTPRPLLARCDQLDCVRKDLVDPHVVGLLSEGRMREIELALMSALGIEIA
jgi:mRNA-degrading endonuclease toxin of MazEF toxin-antitoxin module